MAAAKSTVIWLKVVELNNFPDYIKSDLFTLYKTELLDLMLIELEKERSNQKTNFVEKINNLIKQKND